MRQLILILSLILLNSPVAANEFYGPIQPGDILWDIAKQITPDPTVNRYQIMLALLKINPHAFRTPCNLNTLKVGQRLRKPNLLEIQALTPQQAKQEYEQQTKLWRNYRLTKQPIQCPKELITVPTTIDDPVKKSISTPQSIPTSIGKTAEIIVQKYMRQPQTPPENISIESTINERIANLFSETMTYLGTMIQQIPLSQWTLTSGISIILLILVIIWIVQRHLRRKTITQEHSFAVLTEQTWPPGNKITIPHLTSLSTAEDSKLSSSSLSSPLADVQNKLTYLRTYLADGEEQARQLLLKTILETGSLEQKEEARQLNDIFNKINSLSSTPAQSAVLENRWQTILHQLLPFPLSKDFPNNQQELFTLIDRVFMLLDEAINAKGQLLETYRQRVYNSCLNGQDYQVVPVSDENAESSDNAPISAHQTTRYL